MTLSICSIPSIIYSSSNCVSELFPLYRRYLIYKQQQQQQQQRLHRGQVSVGASSDTPHPSSPSTTATTEQSWWNRLLSFPTTVTTPSTTPTITAAPPHVKTKVESKYAALLNKYGKVPAAAPLSLPSFRKEVPQIL